MDSRDVIEYASKSISHSIRGKDGFVDLSFGEPWFGPPDAAKAALQELSADGMCLNRYAPPFGSIQLRSAIANRYRELYSIEIDPECVLVTHGASGAFCLAILALTNPGDQILITDPTYMLYERSSRILGREPIHIPRRQLDFSSLIISDLQAALDANPRAKVLVINSPENPTGLVCSREKFTEIVSWCQQHGVWLLHDEVYDSFVFSDRHVPAVEISSAGVVMLNSCSKRYGMPGLRIGWLLIEDKEILRECSKIHDYCYFSVNVLAQDIAARVIGDTGLSAWVSGQCNEIRDRTNRFKRVFDHSTMFDLDATPQGAFFMFPKITDEGKRVVSRWSSGSLSDAMAQYLKAEHKIAVVPGSVYGASVEDRIRVVTSVAPDVFDEAINRFATL